MQHEGLVWRGGWLGHLVYRQHSYSLIFAENEELLAHKPFSWNLGYGKEKSTRKKFTSDAEVLPKRILILPQNLVAAKWHQIF